jgi:hypothetical protein
MTLFPEIAGRARLDCVSAAVSGALLPTVFTGEMFEQEILLDETKIRLEKNSTS